MKLGGGIEASNVRYGEDSLEVKVQAVTSMDATPTDAILKDEDGYVISGKWECENGIVVELADNVLTISGKGTLGKDVRKIITKTICWSGNYKVKCIINDGITKMQDELFSYFKGLDSIKIPNSVTWIEKYTFLDCSNLNSIEVAEDNPVYDSRENCNAIIEKETNKLIRGSNNTKIPNSVVVIGDDAFRGCSSLSSIEIPSSVLVIEPEAVSDCGSLNSIEVAEDNLVYDSRENCNAIIEKETNKLIRGSNNTKIPSSVISIGEDAFYNCSNLSSIEIPSSVISIGDYAFCNCSSLSSIEIPSSVTSIKDTTFYNCSSLSNIEIPSSVTSIGSFAFLGCSSLSNIEIPSSVTSIGDSVFFGCSSLTKVTNNSSDYLNLVPIHYSNENGQWYLENTDTIIDKIANGQTAIYKKIGEDVKYGDINSDGEINIQDTVILIKHLAGIKGLNIDMTASDVNVDGEVNIQDAVILIKHLAGMNVTMGKK